MISQKRRMLRKIRKHHRMGVYTTWGYVLAMVDTLEMHRGGPVKLNRYHRGMIAIMPEIDEQIDGSIRFGREKALTPSEN